MTPKFRAWKHTESPEMINDIDFIDWKNGIVGFPYQLSRDTFREDEENINNMILMQYTGKKDINGVEIYEGNIVNNGQHTYLVRFGEFTDSDDFQYPASRQTGFYIVDIHTDETFPFYSLMYRVIGNAYQNKELLED